MPRAFLIKKKKCTSSSVYDVINDENTLDGKLVNDENKEVFPKTKKRKSYEAMTRCSSITHHQNNHKLKNQETKNAIEFEEKSENSSSPRLISPVSAPYGPHFLQHHLTQKLNKSEAALQHWMRPFLSPYLPIHFPYLYYAPEVACPRASSPTHPSHLSPYAPSTKDYISRGEKHIEPAALPATEATSNLYSPITTTLEELDSKAVSERPKRSSGDSRYQCPECQKSYSTYSGLSKHQQFHCAVVNKRTFSCKYCEKVYQSLGALKMHIRTHTLPCKCDLCGKAFSRPWLLQGHIRTHTGEKPFSCSHCDRAFADRSNLRAHLQTHSEVKKYSCKTCTKTFSRMSLLLKHEDGNCCNVNH